MCALVFAGGCSSIHHPPLADECSGDAQCTGRPGIGGGGGGDTGDAPEDGVDVADGFTSTTASGTVRLVASFPQDPAKALPATGGKLAVRAWASSGSVRITANVTGGIFTLAGIAPSAAHLEVGDVSAGGFSLRSVSVMDLPRPVADDIFLPLYDPTLGPRTVGLAPSLNPRGTVVVHVIDKTDPTKRKASVGSSPFGRTTDIPPALYDGPFFDDGADGLRAATSTGANATIVFFNVDPTAGTFTFPLVFGGTIYGPFAVPVVGDAVTFLRKEL